MEGLFSYFIRILELIPSPELKKYVQGVLQIQVDIDIFEREQYNIVKILSEREINFKRTIKKNLTQQKSAEIRGEIENKSNELKGLISQICNLNTLKLK